MPVLNTGNSSDEDVHTPSEALQPVDPPTAPTTPEPIGKKPPLALQRLMGTTIRKDFLNNEPWTIQYKLSIDMFCSVFSKSVFTIQINPKLFQPLGYGTLKIWGRFFIWIVLDEVTSHCE